MKRIAFLSLLAFGLTCLVTSRLQAQDGALPGPGDMSAPSTNAAPAGYAATPADISAAIAAKEAEIAQLKEQLAKANGQIQNLSQQNQQLQTTDATLKTEVQNPAPSPAPLPAEVAPVPLTATPDTSSPIKSMDLFWYFHNSPDVADQYLKDRRLSVNGKVVGFDGPILSREFGIQLESGDPNLRVICKFGIPRIYSTVVLERRTGAIKGRTSTGREDVLLNLGDLITIEGDCHGLDDADVELGNCRLLL